MATTLRIIFIYLILLLGYCTMETALQSSSRKLQSTCFCICNKLNDNSLIASCDNNHDEYVCNSASLVNELDCGKQFCFLQNKTYDFNLNLSEILKTHLTLQKTTSYRTLLTQEEGVRLCSNNNSAKSFSRYYVFTLKHILT